MKCVGHFCIKTFRERERNHQKFYHEQVLHKSTEFSTGLFLLSVERLERGLSFV